MTFEKRADGCWYWSYTGANNKGHIRILWLIWLFIIVLLFAAVGFASISVGVSMEMIRTVFPIVLAVAALVTIIFVLIWLWERLVRKTYSYAVNERVLKVSYGRYRSLSLDDVKSLTCYRERDVIIAKASVFSLEIFAAEDDFDAVWSFLKEHCLKAKIV